jgi:hypothetical protein
MCRHTQPGQGDIIGPVKKLLFRVRIGMKTEGGAGQVLLQQLPILVFSNPVIKALLRPHLLSVPIISILNIAAIFSGSNCCEKYCDPKPPSSSAVKATNTRVRALLFAFLKCRARRITAVVPEASSLAPL